MSTKLITKTETATLEPILIGARDAAKLLGISEKTLWNRTADKTIPSKKIGSRVLYSVSALKKYAEAL